MKSKINKSDIINYEFCYQCPLDWNTLTPTDDEKTRLCDLCHKNVYFVETQEDLNVLSSKGNCIAFFPKEPEPLPIDRDRIPLMGDIISPSPITSSPVSIEIPTSWHTPPKKKKTWWKFWE